LEIATDDGSYGTCGFITDLLKRDIAAEQFDMIYSCGPLPMLKKVVKIAEENRIPCQVSLEQRKGCGFGACLVCACKTHAEGDGWQYSHVCKDGPVFNSRDVIWE
jgi:dihydroorotate dehydrogenase electron transfer subunit